MEQLRVQARREPGVWHLTRTRRFGIHLAWLHTPSDTPEDRLRVLREYVRPFSDDLVAVAQYLPPDLEIADLRMIQTPKVPILHASVLELDLRSGPAAPRATACQRCGRSAGPGSPLFGDTQICVLCATTPARDG